MLRLEEVLWNGKYYVMPLKQKESPFIICSVTVYIENSLVKKLHQTK